MDYWQYITREGDRWDLIAQRFYGDATDYEGIVAANPAVPIIPLLPSGLLVRVPIKEVSTIIPSEKLPPWKR